MVGCQAEVRLTDLSNSFSGVSYAVVHPNQDSEDVNIKTVRRWEGRLPGRTNSNKVPTLIALDEDDDYKPYWGYDIPQRLSEKTIKYVKLLLEPDASKRISSLTNVVDPEATGDLLQTMHRNPVDVAALYVRCLWSHAKQEIIDDITQATYDYAEKVFLLTVPAVWSDRAKHNTYLIAVGAGLAGDDHTLHMISEPEAAAVCVLKDPDRMVSLAMDDVYLVVDAGGGTVDLTSYQVQTVEPLTLREVAAGDGDVCGATFLEVEFRKVLRDMFGAKRVNNLLKEPDVEEKVIADFEHSVRDVFTGEDSRRYVMVVPGINDHPRIRSSMLQLKANEIQPIFNPVINKIDALIEKQVASLANRSLRPKAIILVGGLGCNRYLAKHLKARYETTQSDSIEIQQPDSAWESVAKGAVRCEVLGLGGIISLRIARYNIGFTEHRQWTEGKYLANQKYFDEFYGHWRAKNCVCWVLRRNDELKADTQVDFTRWCRFWEDEVDRVSTSKTRRKLYCRIELIASQEDNAPDRPTSKTRSFATVRIPWDLDKFPKEAMKLRTSPKGKKYREMEFVLHMKQSMAGMQFSYSLKGQFCDDLVKVDFHSLPKDVDNDEVMATWKGNE